MTNFRNPLVLTLGVILLKIVCLLVAIAYFTIAERKIRAAIQRRRGPNVVGAWGLLQPAADGLKLIAKEMVIPSHANSRIFVLAPLIVLTLGLLTWSIIPFGVYDYALTAGPTRFVNAVAYAAPQYNANVAPNFYFFNEANTYADVRYGILFVLGLSSLTVYGIIISGWSSNSKYAFLGALRSAAQRVSYEVAISLVILPVVILAGSLNFTEVVNAQGSTVWFISPLLPAAIIFFISRIAETNRTPFDLPEAEAELVAGYNVEYSSIIFARFFLAEYGNRILISLLNVIRFFGGWLSTSNPMFAPAFVLAAKGLVFCFLFVLVRATFPRYRYDQLIDIGWKIFLPIATGFLLVVIGVLSFADAFPVLAL